MRVHKITYLGVWDSMNTDGAKVLVVEDEVSQLELLNYNLAAAGYVVTKAETGEEALLILQEQEFDLILLDWMLPQVSGLEVCRQIKQSKTLSHIPVVMLTARGEEDDKVRGLNTGADDYIVKPYSIKELMARASAAMRRGGADVGKDVLIYDKIKMDMTRHLVTVDNHTVRLGPLEFKLLRVFMKAPGRVFSRDQLLEKVWNESMDIETRTVDVHVGRLRKQLRSASDQNYLRTVRGFGYSLDLFLER